MEKGTLVEFRVQGERRLGVIDRPEGKKDWIVIDQGGNPHKLRPQRFDYIVKGNMIGGFGLVAYPAKYGVSGVMTFVVNHEGVVYEKNLGKDTAKIAQRLHLFDPDKSWNKITDGE